MRQRITGFKGFSDKDDMTDGVLGVQYHLNRNEKASFKLRYQQRAEAAAWAIKKYLRGENIDVVDFGSADGKCLLEIAHKLGEGRYRGIERNNELVRRAPKLPPSVSLRQGDANDVFGVIKDGDATAITALAILEHLENPKCLFYEAFRILKQGGLLVITAPSPWWDKAACCLHVDNPCDYDFHITPVDEKLIRRLGAETGFEFIRHIPFMFLAVSMLPYVKINVAAQWAWKIDRAIGKIRSLRWVFINQCFVLQKPVSKTCENR